MTEDRGEDGFLRAGIDFDKLKDILAPALAEGQETYEFRWVGKSKAMREAGQATTKTLRPDLDESVDFDQSENVFITGDNLEALKILQESYLGAIDMLYIDPPYNTGKDFVYKDNFRKTVAEQDEAEGNLDEEGNRLYKNEKTNPRYHSDWLNMMYPRLVLARNLLKDSGVIFISIDDNEQANLKAICDEIFGEENLMNIVSIKTKSSSGASGGGEDKRLKKNRESLLIYSKSIHSVDFVAPTDKVKISDFIKEHKENNIGFYYTRILEDVGRKILVSDDGIIKIYEHLGFKFSTVSEKMKQENLSIDEVYNKYFDRIFMVTNAQTSLLSKVNKVISDKGKLVSYEYIPKSGKFKGQLTSKFVWNHTLVVWFSDSAFKSEGKVYKVNQLGDLWTDISWGRLDKQGDISFKNGKKPISLIQRMIEICNRKDLLVFDFFGGSGSTAHAVLDMNVKDNGSRKFIICTIDEEYKEVGEFDTIDELSRERIRRAADKIRKEQPDKAKDLDLGFRAFRVDESNFRDVSKAPSEFVQGNMFESVDNIREDATALDLLFQVMLAWGSRLSLKISEQKLEDNTIYSVDEGSFIACFDDRITEETIRAIAQQKPQRAVFKDTSFTHSADKINLTQIFKEVSPETQVKVV